MSTQIRRQRGKGTFIVALACPFLGLAVTCIAAVVPAPAPCSGKKSAPCATKVTVAQGCTLYPGSGEFDGCKGEVIDAPYTDTLKTGQPSNNMTNSSNYCVCAYRYDCVEGSWADCAKGKRLGISYALEVIGGGDRELPSALDLEVDAIEP